VKSIRKITTVVIAMMAVIACAITVYAGDISVRTVNIGMSSSDGVVGTVYESCPVCGASDFGSPTTETSTYEIDTASTKYSKNYSDWKAGEAITVTVTLVPKSNYKFESQYTVVNVIGNNTQLVEKSISARKIKVRLKYWPSMVLPCIDASTVCYDEDNEYKLKWDAVDVDGGKWKNYEVRVMNDDAGSKSVMTKTVHTNSVDLSDMVSDGANIIAIRTIGGSAGKERYTRNSEWVVLGDDTKSVNASVKGSFSGTGDKMVYLDTNGNMISGWLNINSCWYYFDPANKNRAAVNRFALVNGNWYYFASNGVMQVGWIQVDGYWYYMHPIIDGSEGKMETGWVAKGPNGPYYYMNDGSIAGFPLGAMVTNVTTPDGHTVDASGKRVN